MSRRHKRLSDTPVTVEIEKFSHDGRGIARINGKTTFVQNALPNETVTLQYTRQKKDFDEGYTVSVVKPSTHRVEPRCPHYTLCGGCSLQHLDGETQINEKQSLLMDLLARVGRTEPEIVLPPLKADQWNYRNKARLSARYVEKKQSALVGFREKNNPRYITEISQCPVLNARVDAQITHLRAMLNAFEAPHTIAQIEVAAGDHEVALIFRNLEPLSSHDEEKLTEFAKRSNFRIFLQPGGPTSVHLFYPDDGNDFLTYQLSEDNITIKFHPTDFTQVNASLNRLMIQRALKLLALEPEDVVLDLFCGLGNFSLPLARHCAKVIGIEGSEEMVRRARMNAEANGLMNTEFFSANLEDEEALNRFNLKDVTKILLDPPRTGALEIVKKINKLNPQCVVYVSCNPATLARDTDILVNQHGFKLKATGVMDMFPQTAHVESIAVFHR
jgi:23S rRNA (uracil1939-C5)-methyltransferase